MEAKSGVKFKGRWEIEVKDSRDPTTGKRFRDNKGRFLPRQVISKSSCENITTDEGVNKHLNVIYHGATQISPWYCVLSETNTAPAASMTYAVPVFTETTAYSEETRPEYVEAESTAKSITNSANKATFTANATKTFYGAALVGGGSAASTKGDTAGGGTLSSYGLFTTPQPVISGNVVNVTYTNTGSDAG